MFVLFFFVFHSCLFYFYHPSHFASSPAISVKYPDCQSEKLMKKTNMNELKTNKHEGINKNKDEWKKQKHQRILKNKHEQTKIERLIKSNRNK